MTDRSTEIVLATTNANKVLELKQVGERFKIPLLSPAEYRKKYRLDPWPEVEEVGDTFAENAMLKAKAFSEWSGTLALGDDSGLEVHALNGRPGVFSARYAPTDKERIDKLLAELELAEKRRGESDRRAAFRCVLVLCSPKGDRTLQREGSLHGSILHERRGSGGFGYDPIVYLDSLQATLAEVDFETTCKLGFRALAAEELFKTFSELESWQGKEA